MSKKAQQRAARRARLLKFVQSPPQPEPKPRMFPPVREPFYLPDLLGFTPQCWQGDVPEMGEVPVIRTSCPP
ncbi:hypothetical protein [Deinococcus sp. 12RED42]|uniref:hypothetical protein n=1 Tax=Deinococcus sp. 12RED42 TaxID=2745872 RepID=UPI001E5AD37A|nr:hypothetical protein [Deinococcus sp. 12RED42]MCD0164436.1 hypothetical protein [Deinococcus sp. 12RED42]